MRKKFERFGEVMKAIRVHRGYTQAQLGEKIGVHSQFVSNCERRMCALPKANMRKFVRVMRLTSPEKGQLLDALIHDRINETENEWSPILS